MTSQARLMHEREEKEMSDLYFSLSNNKRKFLPVPPLVLRAMKRKEGGGIRLGTPDSLPYARGGSHGRAGGRVARSVPDPSASASASAQSRSPAHISPPIKSDEEESSSLSIPPKNSFPSLPSSPSPIRLLRRTTSLNFPYIASSLPPPPLLPPVPTRVGYPPPPPPSPPLFSCLFSFYNPLRFPHPSEPFFYCHQFLGP